MLKKAKEIDKIPKAPNDWLTSSVISKKSGFSLNRVYKIIDTYRQSNPEYFKQLRGRNGLIREHLSPDLIEIIGKEKGSKVNILEAPIDWQKAEDLAEKTGLPIEQVKKLIAKRRKENPKDIGH